MRGVITLLPNTPLWHGAQLKNYRDNFTLTLPRCIMTQLRLPYTAVSQSVLALNPSVTFDQILADVSQLQG
jgi:hypothetical protein